MYLEKNKLEGISQPFEQLISRTKLEIKFADSLGVSTGGWRKRTDYVNDLFTRGPTEVVARVGSE